MSEKLLELVKRGESEEVEFKNKRVGTENVIVPPEELERIILEKRNRYFDSEICEGASLEDIDEEKVKWFLKEARRERGLKISEDVEIKEALMLLKLLRNGKLTNTALLLFMRNIRKSIWLVPGQVQREEKHEYPPDAIREAIVNAVVHRDYESPSKVQVRVFGDYIEVWNPGKLPEGWTVEKIKEYLQKNTVTCLVW